MPSRVHLLCMLATDQRLRTAFEIEAADDNCIKNTNFLTNSETGYDPYLFKLIKTKRASSCVSWPTVKPDMIITYLN